MKKGFLTSPVFYLFQIMLWAACTPSARGPESQFVLGTVCTINLFNKGNRELYSRAFTRLRELEDILSANREGTDLDQVNKNSGLKPVKVKRELIEVLETALEFAERSGGSFDPSVGPLVKLWGIGTEKARVPGDEEIREALNMINYREIEINRIEETVFLKHPGMALDLGAIAKGYAADELVKLFRREGIERAIIDLGGDIFAMGERKSGKKAEDETFWRIGIQDPRENRGMYLGVLKVKNASVVTSGTYERFLDENGKRYHHIFSVESGFPAENGLLSVTATADNAAEADALSTAAFALGWERGRELIARTSGGEGIFVFEDLSVRLTPGIEKNFSLSAAEYRLAP